MKKIKLLLFTLLFIVFTACSTYRTVIPTGVYQIQSIACPEKIYIGSSTMIPERYYGHLNKLKLNKHSNSKLQKHYNTYGKNDLIFSIIMLVDEDDLIVTEQFYIDELKPFFNERDAINKLNRKEKRLYNKLMKSKSN